MATKACDHTFMDREMAVHCDGACPQCLTLRVAELSMYLRGLAMSTPHAWLREEIEELLRE